MMTLRIGTSRTDHGNTRAPRPSIPLGEVLITPRALGALNLADVYNALQRHAQGDWGEADPSDWRRNNAAVADGTRILSPFRDRDGIEFWLISDANRLATTVLLPSDY